MHQARQVTIAGGATLDASATDRGDGGSIVAWSDVGKPDSQTRVYGTLLAKGGPKGGDGGRIETSGHWLAVAGITANASAAQGKGGVWLLDPYNITISGGTTAAGPSFPNWTSAANTSIIKNTDINTQLNSGTSVSITTGAGGAQAGDITISSSISKTAGGDASLLFKAHRDIKLDDNVDITSTVGALNVTMQSNTNEAGGSIFLVNNNISTNGGAITLGGGSDISTGYATGAAANWNGIELGSYYSFAYHGAHKGLLGGVIEADPDLADHLHQSFQDIHHRPQRRHCRQR